MLEVADLVAGDKVLEPSAGTGNLIRAALGAGIFASDITAVEINHSLIAAAWGKPSRKPKPCMGIFWSKTAILASLTKS